MVPVISSTTTLLLPDLYRSLVGQLRTANTDAVEYAFASWIFAGYEAPALSNLPENFVVTDYHDVARLAFLTEINPQKFYAFQDQLIEGLTRMSGRSSTLPNNQPAPFCHDAIALLGLSLGARRIKGNVQTALLDWLSSFVNPSNENLPSWKRIILFAALGFIGVSLDTRDISGLSKIDDIKLALLAKGADFIGQVDIDAAYQTACYSSLAEDAEVAVKACRAATLYYISNNLPVVSMSSPTIGQVSALLQNITIGLKRWPWEEKGKTPTSMAQKWDLQNEYHVQSLVYFLLAPIFPDIENEFYFDPTGALNSRADIGLPSMNLIIEIKFLRRGVSFAKMIGEIAADASLYFKKDSVYSEKYSKMLVLLWDDSARTQEHHEFKRGVSSLTNVSGAIVISRPGNLPIQEKKRSTKSQG